MTIDNYVVNVYKGLCMTLLIIVGILLAVLVYCISKLTVQKRMIDYLIKRRNTRSVKKKPSDDPQKASPPKKPPVRRKKVSAPKKKD